VSDGFDWGLRPGGADEPAEPEPIEPEPIEPEPPAPEPPAAEPPAAEPPAPEPAAPEPAPTSLPWESGATQLLSQPDQNAFATELFSTGVSEPATELFGSAPIPSGDPDSALDALFGETQFREYETGDPDTTESPFAVRSARAAFEDGRWASKAPAARKKILQKFSELILGAKEELALLETLDMGKPIQYSLAVDVPACARCIAWYAEAVDKIYDEIAPTAANALALVTREPMGVIGVIVPWNYPMIMAAWKLGPALAAGNSVVLKPSEKSPLTALRDP